MKIQERGRLPKEYLAKTWGARVKVEIGTSRNVDIGLPKRAGFASVVAQSTTIDRDILEPLKLTLPKCRASLTACLPGTEVRFAI
jgi:hypothetical protein